MIESIRQVKFLDNSSGYPLYGLLVTLYGGEEYVSCGCCGSIYNLNDLDDNIEIIEIYDDWTNISDTIKSGN